MGGLPSVAVVGHVEWVDFIPVARFPAAGEVVHARGAFTRAAGGGGVVAGVLARAGCPVDFFCALGSDEIGTRAADELGAAGVSTHVAWRPEPTRRAVTLLDEQGERTIVTIGDRLEPRGSDELAWERLSGCASVYFTAGDAGALSRARAAGVVVASPRGLRALSGSPGPDLDAIVFSALDRDEVRWASGWEGRTRWIVATEGAAGGSWWGESSGRWEPVPAPGPVRDAYGCGDAFAAGFTLGLAQGLAVGDAADLGARFGADCLTRSGAP